MAWAAESLAEDLEAGRGPKLGKNSCFDKNGPCCAVGHVLNRAGFESKYAIMSNITAVNQFGLSLNHDLGLRDALGQLTVENDHSEDSLRSQAVIAPLKKLAASARIAANNSGEYLPNLNKE